VPGFETLGPLQSPTQNLMPSDHSEQGVNMLKTYESRSTRPLTPQRFAVRSSEPRFSGSMRGMFRARATCVPSPFSECERLFERMQTCPCECQCGGNPRRHSNAHDSHTNDKESFNKRLAHAGNARRQTVRLTNPDVYIYIYIYICTW